MSNNERYDGSSEKRPPLRTDGSETPDNGASARSLSALAQLSGVKLRSRRVVEGVLVGEHRGAGQGLAIEFAQLRPYTAGDELRSIDWKVFARTDKLHVRQYEEDVDLSVYMLLDASAGMGYKGGASPLSKFEYAQVLAGVNAYLALGQNDSASWAIYAAKTECSDSFRGLSQWASFVDSIEATSSARLLPRGDASISSAITYALTQWQKKGLVLIFSDFFDEPESVESALKKVSAMGHDCQIYQILDRDELSFPFNNRTRFIDLESASHRGLEVEPNELRQAYLNALERHRSAIESICNALEIGYRLAPTDVPIEQVIRRGGAS